MADERDDDLEAEVDEGAEIETERFAEVDDGEDDELLPDSRKSGREEPAAADDEDGEASDTI
jgi:hypothetical protein